MLSFRLSEGDSDSDAPDDRTQCPIGLAMRERRRDRITPKKSIKIVDGVRHVNGVKKRVRFNKKNEIFFMECTREIRNIYYPCTGIWKDTEGVWVDKVDGPVGAKLHWACEGNMSVWPDNRNVLPDEDRFEAIARTARFRDGREDNRLGVPPEIYPFLVQMLAYCKGILLRRHICKLQMIPDDAVPVLSEPRSDEDPLGFREKVLGSYFGKRRDIWPYIVYDDMIYDFSRVSEWEILSRELVVAN